MWNIAQILCKMMKIWMLLQIQEKVLKGLKMCWNQMKVYDL